MKKIQNIQYTIRNIPNKLDQVLRHQARDLGKSLNEVVLDSLERAAGIAHEPVIYNDLDDLIGSWKEDSAFDEAILAQDKIDTEKWS